MDAMKDLGVRRGWRPRVLPAVSVGTPATTPTAGGRQPARGQYRAEKTRFRSDAVLFWHAGDRYEVLWDDARVAADVLGLAVRNERRAGAVVPVVCVTEAEVDGWLRRLIQAGYPVAIWEA